MKYFRLLHDNAPAHKARIVTEYLEAENVTVLPHPRCDFFLFPKLKFHLSGKRYETRNTIGSAIYQYMMGVLIEENVKYFQKWLDRLKKRIQAKGEYFEEQGRIKGSKINKFGRKQQRVIIFGTSLVSLKAKI